MKTVISLLFLISFTGSLYAQKADDILGIWLTQDCKSKIEIKKTPNGYFEGVITWIKNPTDRDGKAQRDIKNPTPELQQRPIIGLKILTGISYNPESKEWSDGTIYDPKSGNTYNCYLWFDEDSNKLKVKGYIGISLIGRKATWTREKA